MPGLVDNILMFGRLLRSSGLEVPVGRLLDVTEALQHVMLSSRDDVYHACRALLVHRREDLALFDCAFDAFWRTRDRQAPAHETGSAPEVPRTAPAGAAAPGAGAAASVDTETVSGVLHVWSDSERLAHKDFGEFTPDEIARARAALDRLEWTPGLRRTRRWVAGHGTRVDLRRALARSVRTGGDLLSLPRRRRRMRPRPLVLLCDVSGSMERYSRMLLHFTHALSLRHGRVEAFLFSTRLTRVTTELRTRSVDAAIVGVARAVPDWSGGTRIGEALRQFHRRWRRRVLHGGPVVLIVSDGWDRGEPALLRDEMRRLQLNCHRLIWLSPLAGTVDYAPLTRGLLAALPYVDDFVPARTLSDLAGLARQLDAIGPATSREFRALRAGVDRPDFTDTPTAD